MISLVALMAAHLQTQTLAAEVKPQFMDGVHFACETTFRVSLRDNRQRHGVVQGAFTFVRWPEQRPNREESLVFLRLSTLFPTAEGGGSTSIEWRPPQDAYIVNGFETNALERMFVREYEQDRGFRIFGFYPNGEITSDSMVRLASEGEIDIAYTMDDMNIPTVFRLSIGDDLAEEWENCAVTLMGRAP